MDDLERKLAKELAARDIAHLRRQITDADAQIAFFERRKRTLEADIAKLEKDTTDA